MQAGRLPTWRNAMENPQPLARTLCIVVAVVLIGFELWSALSAQLGAVDSAHPRTGVVAARTETNIEQITAADLFGHAANQNANLPQTNLQVTLRAIFAASDPKLASAVIESGDGRTQVVKIGGTIDASASLHEVHPNRVVLSRNGSLETLYFPEPQESTSTSLAQNTAQPTAINPENELPADASAEEIKRAAILQRLEELRARAPR